MDPDRSLPPDDHGGSSPDYRPVRAVPAQMPAGRVDALSQRSVALPPALTSAPDVLALLKALQRRWVLALGLGLIGAAIAATAAWYLVPKSKYKATALLHVATAAPKVIFDTLETKTDFRIYQRTQLALVKSRLVLNAALKRPNVAELESVRDQTDQVEWLEQQIKAELPMGSEILQISISGNKAQELAILVNAVADSYMEEIVNKEHNDRLARYEQLKGIYNLYQDRLKQNRETLRKLAESVGSNDKTTIGLKQQLQIEYHAQEQRELLATQAQLKKMQTEVTVIEAAEKNKTTATISDAMIDQHVEKDAGVQRLVSTEADLVKRMGTIRRAARSSNDPALQKTARDLDGTRKSLADLRVKLRPKIKKDLNDSDRSEQSTRLADLKNQMVILSEYEKVLQQSVDRIGNETTAFNKKSLDLQSLQDEILHADDAAKRIGGEVEALSVELKAPARVKVIERAENPRMEDSTKRFKMIGMVALGVFTCAVMGVSWREYRTRRIDSVDEVVHGLGIRLVGSLPALPNRPRRLSVGAKSSLDPHWQDILVESIDATRTILLRDFRTEGLRVVMITSSSKGEGKTSLSSHLAISLSRTGRKTLLVDMDLRNPSVHRLFDVPCEPGISELLRGEIDVEDAIKPVLGDLDVITAGRGDSRAIRALAQDNLPALFEQLKERHDFVIVDTAPVLPVADTLLISQHVDAAVFSVYRDVSRIPTVYSGYERLATLGVRMLGVVVTGIPTDRYGQEYYYYGSGRAKS